MTYKSPLNFDEFATNYRELLHDPARERFAPGSTFFVTRKVLLLRQFFATRNILAKSLRWLDIGCGRGDLLRAAGNLFESAVGCDPSWEMLRACSDLTTYVQTTPMGVPFEDQSFDLATLVCVLHHVLPTDRKHLIADAFRVVRPGGWVCIIEHNPFNPMTRRIVSRTPVDADAQLLTAAQSRQLVMDTGCLVAHAEYFLYFPESLYDSLRWLEGALARLPLGGQYAVIGQRPPEQPCSR